jgi:hypothetical protein
VDGTGSGPCRVVDVCTSASHVGRVHKTSEYRANHLFQLENGRMDFNEIWYVKYATARRLNLIRFKFLNKR